MIDYEINKETGKQWQRIVYGEVLTPNQLTDSGDLWTPQAIERAAKSFEDIDVPVDIEHNFVNVEGKELVVIDSFIATEKQTEYTTGSWVVGVQILDDALWRKVLDREINGFSYAAKGLAFPVIVTIPQIRMITGTTAPNLDDGHTHEFFVTLDEDGYVTSGGTTVVQGHSHPIKKAMFTERAELHLHLYDIMTIED